MNDRTAKRIIKEDRYPYDANSPTQHSEYVCPCGKGKIVYEHVVGFGDFSAWIECKKCDKKYEIVMGCGYLWELREK
ncbi:MAG: hypothetical protein J6D23_07755 [Clostridia bacterium]|nr:hypothetical protein [Clostridia bacterium]